MSPLQFESAHAAVWQELEQALDGLERPRRRRWLRGRRGQALPVAPPQPARLAALYRRACEHLALARSRAYPLPLVERLESLTARAHQAIYRRHDYGIARLAQLVLVDIPQAVRAQRHYVLVAALVFGVPLLLTGWAAWRDPGFVLSVVDASQAHQYENMYRQSSHGLAVQRAAATDWGMFGFYIRHNIGIGFQCFAGGVLFGLGSLFYLAYNGVFGGAIAGYVAAQGHADTFFPFVVTHSAFELTATVLSGAAGLRVGHALLAPGRLGRLAALREAMAESLVVVYGVVAMLVVAAVLEAFWSSSAWVAAPVKYAVGAACWTLVFAYLGWQGRPKG